MAKWTTTPKGFVNGGQETIDVSLKNFPPSGSKPEDGPVGSQVPLS